MNFRQLAEKFELEEDEFLELAELLLETSRSDLSRLQAALDAGKASEVVEAAHSIKGAAGNLGFLDISRAAAEIERKARENRLEGSAAEIERIKGGLDSLAKDLSSREGGEG